MKLKGGPSNESKVEKKTNEKIATANETTQEQVMMSHLNSSILSYC